MAHSFGPLLAIIVLRRVRESGGELPSVWTNTPPPDPVLVLRAIVALRMVSGPFREKIAPPAARPDSVPVHPPVPPMKPFTGPWETEFCVKVLFSIRTLPPSLKMAPPRAPPPPPQNSLALPPNRPPLPGPKEAPPPPPPPPPYAPLPPLPEFVNVVRGVPPPPPPPPGQEASAPSR